MRAIQFSPAAFRELEEWGQVDWRRQQKVLELIQHVAREPFTGTGKPDDAEHFEQRIRQAMAESKSAHVSSL